MRGDTFDESSEQAVPVMLAIMSLSDVLTRVIEQQVGNQQIRPFTEVCDELFEAVLGSQPVSAESAVEVMTLAGQSPLDITCALLRAGLDIEYSAAAAQRYKTSRQDVKTVLQLALGTMCEKSELSLGIVRTLEAVLTQILQDKSVE